MAASKKRVYLSMNVDLYNEFESLRKHRKQTSLSDVILDLAKEALEIDEDLYYENYGITIN